MLTGSLASAFYGAGRATMDIDLVIDPTIDQLRGFVDALRPDRFYASLDAALEARRHESLFNVVDAESGWKVDLIMRKSRPFSRAEFERRVSVEFEGLSLVIATVEDVIISKLEWARLGGSARQIEDVAGLLRVRHQDLDQGYVARWIGELGLEEQWTAARKLAGVAS
jgi:hypothetical protein